MLNAFSKTLQSRASKQLHDWWAIRVDAVAVRTPRVYFFLVSILAAAGYVYLLLFPALVVFGLVMLGLLIRPAEIPGWEITDWLMRVSFLIITGIAAWVTYKIITAKPELPKCRTLTNDDSQSLLHRIRELSGTYNSPPIHIVCLTSRFDVELIRTPVCGYPVKFKNTLLIGLPVMMLTSPLHLKILIARKIGQLSNSMHRTTGRLYFLHNIWSQYQQLFSHNWQLHNLLLWIFFSWYAPFFHASTIPARRIDEHIADKRALEIANSHEVAEMIAILEVKSAYLKDKFWPLFFNMAYTCKTPRFLPYENMDKIMGGDLDAASAQYYLDRALSSEENPVDTIPLLSDRLSVLGIDKIRIPAQKDENAGSHFFGRNLPLFQKRYDTLWYNSNKQGWHKRYMLGKKEQRHLESLRYQSSQSLLSSKEIGLYLKLIVKYVPHDQATPLYLGLLESSNLDASILLKLGRLLVDTNHGDGIKALVESMTLDDDLTVECCQLIIKYMVQNGNMKEAQNYRRKILAHQVGAG